VDSSPVVSGKYVYVGSDDGNLYALGLADGKEVWHFAAGGAIRASPAVAAGRLVIGTEDGAVYCFSASDREPK
jgi:outer membrane protein assembly factor BamB